jgi:hypothetical protein
MKAGSNSFNCRAVASKWAASSSVLGGKNSKEKAGRF